MLKKNSMRFAAALIAALISFVVGPNAVLAAAPQRHDQVPGFYRLKSRRPRSNGAIRWLRRNRPAVAKRAEGDDGWCC